MPIIHYSNRIHTLISYLIVAIPHKTMCSLLCILIEIHNVGHFLGMQFRMAENEKNVIFSKLLHFTKYVMQLTTFSSTLCKPSIEPIYNHSWKIIFMKVTYSGH